jgi:probable HAF family extracellular repeat protein
MKLASLICTTSVIAMGLTAAQAAAQGAPPSANPLHYVVYLLSNPVGGMITQGTSINVENETAGFGTLPGNSVMHAVYWRHGLAGRDLGTLGGPNSAVAWPNRNDRGVIAGVSETAKAQPNGETWSCAAAAFFLAPPTGNVCVGFRWESGHMTALPTLGGDNGFATGINNAGQIVGWAETPVHDSSCISPQVLQFEAVLWGPKSNQLQPLAPYPGDPDSAATAINNEGQAVGISGLCGNAVGGASAVHMVLWENNKVTSLPTLGGGYWNTPMDINENGDVTGFSDLPGDSAAAPNFNAFLWTRKNGTINLGTLSGDNVSEALGINDQDRVVGVSYPSGHAFIWQNGKMTDLNSLVPRGTSVILTDAQDINDDGVITGQAQAKNGSTLYAFVAIPKLK